jgi:hypothetical protein
MTQGHDYGKQFHNDVISQWLLKRVELLAPTSAQTIVVFEIFTGYL